ncbi:hypothetical protein VSQ78_03890 [Nocardiopsis alba]|uniref:Uncharacterized protein n=1 Tax=Nocardiopsis alba TaxID=53437 RepID=A0ABV5DQI8_9ACTN
MGSKKIWASALGTVALVLAGFWAIPRLFPGLDWGLNELNQVAGIASLAVAAAALVMTVWTSGSDAPSHDGGEDAEGDSIEMDRVRAQGSVTGKAGPETTSSGDRIRMRGIRAGKDVVGKKTTQARRRPPR